MYFCMHERFMRKWVVIRSLGKQGLAWGSSGRAPSWSRPTLCFILVGVRGLRWYSFPWINDHSPCKPICPLDHKPHIQERSTAYSALHLNVLECAKIWTGVHVSWWLYSKLQDFVCWGSGDPVTRLYWKEGLRSVVLESFVEGGRHVSKNLLLVPMSLDTSSDPQIISPSSETLLGASPLPLTAGSIPPSSPILQR